MREDLPEEVIILVTKNHGTFRAELKNKPMMCKYGITRAEAITRLVNEMAYMEKIIELQNENKRLDIKAAAKLEYMKQACNP